MLWPLWGVAGFFVLSLLLGLVRGSACGLAVIEAEMNETAQPSAWISLRQSALAAPAFSFAGDFSDTRIDHGAQILLHAKQALADGVPLGSRLNLLSGATSGTSGRRISSMRFDILDAFSKRGKKWVFPGSRTASSRASCTGRDSWARRTRTARSFSRIWTTTPASREESLAQWRQ